MLEEKRFAVLIDADNVSVKYIKFIMDEISNYGVATYKRIYGDWTKPNSASWKDVLLENSVTPVQQYGYTVGKNATDSAMIIDAMDILYSKNVEGFCIISSDSDFTKLSSRLRESGMLVVGMGEKKTPKSFIASCNQFKYLDILAATEKMRIALEEKHIHAEKSMFSNQNPVKYVNEIPMDISSKSESIVNTQETNETVKNMTDLKEIKTAILKMMNEVDGEHQQINMGELGNRLVKRYPDFDVRNYGDTKLSKFLRKFDFLEIRTDGKGGSSMWVSLKSEARQKKNVKAFTHKPKKKKTNKKKHKSDSKTKL
jgi:uncharacterized LabA/DUF88 family protein